jgi:aldehyde dehydrogenase (NAD+)
MNPAAPDGPADQRAPARARARLHREGEAGGAKLARAAACPKDSRSGYFVEPTLFVDVDPKSPLAQEEVFGPVLRRHPFEDDDDAVRIANDSIYGLSGASRAQRGAALAVARRIPHRTLGVNGAMWFAVDYAFRWLRQSGVGRENGIAGFEEYSRRR